MATSRQPQMPQPVTTTPGRRVSDDKHVSTRGTGQDINIDFQYHCATCGSIMPIIPGTVGDGRDALLPDAFSVPPCPVQILPQDPRSDRVAKVQDTEPSPCHGPGLYDEIASALQVLDSPEKAGPNIAGNSKLFNSILEQMMIMQKENKGTSKDGPGEATSTVTEYAVNLRPHLHQCGCTEDGEWAAEHLIVSLAVRPSSDQKAHPAQAWKDSGSWVNYMCASVASKADLKVERLEPSEAPLLGLGNKPFRPDGKVTAQVRIVSRNANKWYTAKFFVIPEGQIPRNHNAGLGFPFLRDANLL